MRVHRGAIIETLPSSINDALVAQRRDVRGRVAELAEDLVGVLPERRRRTAHGCRVPGELDR